MVISSKRVRVPSYIAFVDYIESTGAQYIDTGISPSTETTVHLVYQYVSLVSGSEGYDMIAGVRSSGPAQYRFYPVSLNGSLTKERYVMGNTALTVNYNSAERREILFNDTNHNVYVDGALVGTLNTFTTGEKTMWLFAANSEEATRHWYAAAKIYSCQIYDSGVLIRDYWPCYDPDGVACLYDKVSETYFYNAGTGVFTAG